MQELSLLEQEQMAAYNNSSYADAYFTQDPEPPFPMFPEVSGIDSVATESTESWAGTSTSATSSLGSAQRSASDSGSDSGSDSFISITSEARQDQFRDLFHISDDLAKWICEHYYYTREYLHDEGTKKPKLEEKIKSESRKFENRGGSGPSSLHVDEPDNINDFIEMMWDVNFCCTGERRPLSTLYHPEEPPLRGGGPKRRRINNKKPRSPKWTVFNEFN